MWEDTTWIDRSRIAYFRLTLVRKAKKSLLSSLTRLGGKCREFDLVLCASPYPDRDWMKLRTQVTQSLS